MRLLRVQVPEFRALKDVDISFEPEFTPQVFPLGSLNGGGKSTLLQLIFVLLHCANDSSKRMNFNNLINDFIVDLGKKDSISKYGKNTLAKINLLGDSKEKIELEFLYSGVNHKIINLNSANTINLFSNNEYVFYMNSNLSQDMLPRMLANISSKIFLIAPANQSYLFVPREFRRLLFTLQSETSYNQVLNKLKDTLPNFFTYDFIEVLTEIFRLARDKDYDERNKKSPFAHSEKLETDINDIFIDGKKIIPLTVQQKRHTKDSIQSMGFKLPDGTEIYPEDLSHGELKRLTIFILIKFYEIQDSIVLMDEIESAFHPDWQRHIVDDLVEWGASNQYILATHSYELCRGVTPAHVKELAPNLFPESYGVKA